MPSRSRTHNPLARLRKLTGHARTVRQVDTQRMYWGRWRKASRLFLLEHPFCAHCEAEQVAAPAVVTDHVIPHKGDLGLFWNPDNWQPLCKLHHDRKTASEDGGFGRTVSRAPDDLPTICASLTPWAEYVGQAGPGFEGVGDKGTKADAGRRAPQPRAGRGRSRARSGASTEGGGGSNVQPTSITSPATSKKTRARNWIRGGTIEQGPGGALVDWWNR